MWLFLTCALGILHELCFLNVQWRIHRDKIYILFSHFALKNLHLTFENSLYYPFLLNIVFSLFILLFYEFNHQVYFFLIYQFLLLFNHYYHYFRFLFVIIDLNRSQYCLLLVNFDALKAVRYSYHIQKWVCFRDCHTNLQGNQQ